MSQSETMKNMHRNSQAGITPKAYLEPEEVARLEKSATNLRDRLLIRLLFHLGCRVSEALAVEANDVDFAQGTINIEHLKVRIRFACPQCGARLGKAHVFCPKCGTRVEQALTSQKQQRRLKRVPLDGETLEMLKDYIRRGERSPERAKHSSSVSIDTAPGRCCGSALRGLALIT